MASRLDAELARDDAELVELDQLLAGFQNTYENMGVSARQNTPKLSLEIEYPPKTTNSRRGESSLVWTVSGHQGRLGQVIANLIENARSFTPSSGGEICIKLRRKGPLAVFSVTDNGPGIPPENTERIFERFYTDRPDGEAFGQNSGLGLSITRQIIEAHGGTIRADNVDPSLGTGARFTVSIPIYKLPT